MFVNYITETPTCFVSLVWQISGGRFPCLVLLLLLCLFASSSCLFGMWLYIVYIHITWCTFLWKVRLCSQPNLPQTSTWGTHTHRQHTATYQINNFATQTSREVVTALSTKDNPPEDGQTIVTETCRGFNDVFYKHF